jgi:hypothetical protein
LKYVIFDELGIEVGVMFNELLKHDAVAAGRKCVSAGYCDRDGNAWGSSTLLGLRARTEDSEVLKLTIELRA